MEKYECQLYLYAKHWFKETDLVEDLKVIFAKRNGVEPKYIQDGDLFSWVLGITSPNIIDIRDFLVNAFKYYDAEHPLDRPTFKDSVSFIAILKQCMSVLRLTQVQFDDGKILDLGEPDYTLLPKKEKSK